MQKSGPKGNISTNRVLPIANISIADDVHSEQTGQTTTRKKEHKEAKDIDLAIIDLDNYLVVVITHRRIIEKDTVIIAVANLVALIENTVVIYGLGL